jgi:hypothetical protein
MVAFLRRFDHYLDLVRMAQAHPDNRTGSDKTWVERAMREYHQHYRGAKRRE